MIYIGKNGAFYDYTGSNSGDIYYSGRWKKGSKMSVRGDRFVIEGKGNDFNYTWSYKISGNKCRASFRISSKEKAWKVDSEREHTMKCTVHDGNKFAR